MKKGTSVFCIISAILCLCASGCKLKIEEEVELLPKPDIYFTSGYLTVSIPKTKSKTDYINIYRHDSKNNEEIVGIIYPKDLSSDVSSYEFVDKLVCDKYKYKYKVRYHDSDGFHYSEWSNEHKVEAGKIKDTYTNPKDLKYELSSTSTKLQFSETDFTLKVISGSITAPSAITGFSTNYIPVLIIKASSDIRAFEIKDNPDDFLDGTEPISLRGFLPNDFKDKSITIVGIAGQTKELANPGETDPKKQIAKYIRWTGITSLKVMNHSDNTIIVPSESGSKGHDFSSNVR